VIRVDGFILTPPRTYPYPIQYGVTARVHVSQLLHLVFGDRVIWRCMN